MLDWPTRVLPGTLQVVCVRGSMHAPGASWAVHASQLSQLPCWRYPHEHYHSRLDCATRPAWCIRLLHTCTLLDQQARVDIGTVDPAP